MDSPAHKLGQIIGDLLEIAIEPDLAKFAKKHDLYLDKQGPRPARKKRKTVIWIDDLGNAHRLDFVLERGGTHEKIGVPVGFIECAWRSYTKHSKNKAQEIQSAIEPLARTHFDSAPFIGAVLAGHLTAGSLTQIKSNKFKVLLFTYENVIKAFDSVGIDVRFDQYTPDEEIFPKISAWKELSLDKQMLVPKKIVELQRKDVDQFILSLERMITRKIELVRILPLFGKDYNLNTIDEAISFIQTFDVTVFNGEFVKYEVEIRYTNGDKINGIFFYGKDDALEFLNKFK